MDFFVKLAFIGLVGGIILVFFGTMGRDIEQTGTPAHKVAVQMQRGGVAFLVVGTLSFLFG